MRAATPGALRLGAVLLAVAAAILSRGGTDGRTVRVLALDDSRSVAGDREGARRAVDAANDGLPAGGLVGMVPFSGPAVPPVDRLAPPVPGGGAETDVAAALRAALALIPEEARGEILLATDGRATRGDTAAAMAEIRRRGVALRTIPLGAEGLPPRVADIDAPPVVRVGERFPLSVEVTGSPGARGEVRLEDGGAGTAESRPVAIPAGGRARVVFARSAAAPGVRRYRAFVPGPLAAAWAEAAVLVAGDAAILRLGRHAPTPGVAALLRSLGGGRFRDAVGAGPVDAALAGADLSSLSGVVLDDLPEGDLPPEAGERLRGAVHDGLGLAVIGGPGTLGAGGFAGRPLEGALPVRCAPERPRPLVVLAIDVSGSMEGEGGDGPSPAAEARAAAMDLARRLPHVARLALVRFHDRLDAESPVFDLGELVQRSGAVEAAARRHPPGGGTRFGAAVEGALGAAARAPGAGRRLLLVVTDGRPAEEPEELRRLAGELAAARFATTVVAVGGRADLPRLAAFAGEGTGAVVTAASGRLAAVLLGLAGGADASLWEPRESGVRPGPDPAPFGAAPAGLPPVAGFDRVFARPEGRVWLALEDGAPLLAGREAGLGRSVVFAAAPGAGSGEWATAPAAALLEAAFRWALRRPEVEAVEVRARLRADGDADAVLETLPASAPAGEVRASGTPLRRTGPARWEGTVSREALGAEGVVVFESGGAILARAPAVAPAAAEDRALGPDAGALALLSAPGRPVAGTRDGAGGAALAAALAALALLVAAAAGEGRSSREVPSV